MNTRHVQRRTVGALALSASAALTLSLAACGTASGGEQSAYEPAGEDEKVELTIWFGREDYIPDDAFAAFEAEYPNIDVKADVIPTEQIPSSFIRQFEAGDAPDIIQPDNSQVAGLSMRGMLYDTTELMQDWEESNPDLYDAMSDIAWEMASYDGVPYGVALFHGVFWNVYRTDVLQEAGVEVPTTWEEVLTNGSAIMSTSGMYGFGVNGSRDQTPEWDKALFAQMGGEWVDGVMQIDSEAGRYWLNWYQRAVTEGVVDADSVAFAWPDLIRNFAQGQSAMAQISSNVYNKDIVPELTYGEQWDVMTEPIARPGAEEESRYITNGWPYLVSAQTENPYEVGLLLQYLADDPQALSVAIRYQPTSNTRVMTSEAYLAQNPWEAELVEAWTEVEVRPFHPNQSEMDGVIRDAMQEALTNPDADVAEMATRYQATLDELAAEVEE